MRFASWNVNGLRARQKNLDAWLSLRAPHTVALQEIRCPPRAFPTQLCSEEEYFVERNEHVALASVEPLIGATDLLGDGRALLATTAGISVVAVYAPNGTKAGTPRHQTKLDWFDAFVDRLGSLPTDHLLVLGDLNIARDDRDVWAPERYRRRNLFTIAERQRLENLLDLGLTDLFRHHHEGSGAYTWWNHAHDSFNRNRGWRLDYLLASSDLSARSEHVVVDIQERANPDTSDHAPLWVDLGPTP